jgi:hypothetical protein
MELANALNHFKNNDTVHIISGDQMYDLVIGKDLVEVDNNGRKDYWIDDDAFHQHIKNMVDSGTVIDCADLNFELNTIVLRTKKRVDTEDFSMLSGGPRISDFVTKIVYLK